MTVDVNKAVVLKNNTGIAILQTFVRSTTTAGTKLIVVEAKVDTTGHVKETLKEASMQHLQRGMVSIQTHHHGKWPQCGWFSYTEQEKKTVV